MARIYVSSTFKDLKECREKVRVTLKQMSHEDIAMEYYVAEDKRPVDKCLEDVASCDLYIGTFAWRYGFVPDGYDKSITELEYRKAAETGKDCLIFLLSEDAPWPPMFVDIGKDAEKIRALRAELSKKYMVSFFKSADELARLVSAAIYKWKNESRSSFSEPIHIAPIQVQALTEPFVELPVMQEIKSHLLNGSNSKGILAITAIQGLGGIGKTTLAKIIAHDKEVQRYFSNGILWVTLGQEPDKLSLLNGWIQALGDYQSNHTTVEMASNHLRTLLYGKHILIVVDDAWDPREIQPFLVGGPNCQTIITTRKAYIADFLGVECYSLDVMTPEQSLQLFENVLKDFWNESEKEDALKVAKDVGYLPLALNLAAKRRKRDYSWIKIHEALEEEIARLSVLNLRRLGKEDEGLEASLNLSLKALRSYNEEAFLNFIWLGVLHEDVQMNEKMASTLWGIDKEEAGDLLEVLWEEGLLTQDSIIQLGSEKLKTYRIHDLFHDIALHYLTCSPTTEKSTELPGLGLTLNESHASLLNRYQSKMQKEGLWHTLEDDAYIHSHLTWHMEKAGQIEDIHKLLSEENENGKNGWYEALESLGQNAVFIEDVIRAWNLSEKESIHQIEPGGKASSIGLETRYALIYASINSLSANIPEELLISFLETNKWTEAQVFTYAQKEPDPYKRAVKLISIYQEINGEYIKKEEILKKALDVAYKIKDNYDRAKALLAIIPYLNGQVKEEVIEKTLDALSIIENDYGRVRVLSAIVPYLDGRRKEEMMEKVLDEAYRIQDTEYKVEALSAIVPYLDGKEKVIEKALDAAYKIENDKHRIVRALSAIVPYLDDQKKEEAIKKALDAIFRIKYNGYFITGALSTIVPYLNGKEKEKVIEEALDEASNLAVALLAIVPNLDGQKKEEVIDKTLDAAYKLEDNDYTKVKVLLAVVSYLDDQKKEEVIEKALDAAYKIEYGDSDYPRVEVFSSIVPYLDGQKKEEMMEKALDEAYKIEDNDARVRTLSAIIPYLDGQKKEEMIEKALDIASKIETKDYKKVLAISFIIPHLDGRIKKEMIEKALDSVFKIIDNDARVRTLSFIVPYLDSQKKEEVMEKALDLASKAKDYNTREKEILTIIPYLDGQKKEEVIKEFLDSISKIKDDYARAEALSTIVPYLENEELMEKALDIASNIHYDNARAEALLTIIPYPKSQKKEEVIEKVLVAASKIKDNYYTKAYAFFTVVPYLECQKKEEVIEKALDAACKIEDCDGDFSKVDAFSSIIPYLDCQKKEEVIEKALDSISKIIDDGYDDESVAALSFIAPYFVGQKEEVIEKVLYVVSKIEYNDVRAEALSVIVPYLDGQKRKEAIEKVLDAAYKINDNNYTKAEALSVIVPYLDGQKREEAIENVLDAAYKIENDTVRVNDLLTIIPYLDDQKIEDCIEKVLDVASKIRSGIGISKIISSITPKLDGQQREELMEKAFDVTFKIENDNERAEALNIMLPHLGSLPMNNLYFWWRKAVQSLRERTRSSLLLDIIVLIPFISELGEDGTLFEISQAIIDVSNWFP